MKAITSISENEKSFAIDGVPFSKIYQMKVGATEKQVSLVNVFDRTDVVFENEDVANITIEGDPFDFAIDLINAFEPLKANFNKAEAPALLILKAGKSTFNENPTGATEFEVNFEAPISEDIDADDLIVLFTPISRSSAGARVNVETVSNQGFTVTYSTSITLEITFGWAVVRSTETTPK